MYEIIPEETAMNKKELIKLIIAVIDGLTDPPKDEEERRQRRLLFRALWFFRKGKLGDVKSQDYENPMIHVLFAIRIAELELSVRTTNCLLGAEIETIGQLVQKTPEELLMIRNFGRKCLRELEEAIMEPLNFRFGMKPSFYGTFL